MQPFMIIFAGKAGTGKTTLARALSRQLHIPYFDYDTLVQPFLKAIEKRYGLGNNGRNSFYQNWRSVSYETLWSPVLENINLGEDVILSAPFSKEILDASFPDELRKKTDNSFSLLLCYMAPPPDIHYNMLSDRASERDSDVLQNKDLFYTGYKAEMPQWKEELILYLASGDMRINMQKIVQKIRELK